MTAPVSPAIDPPAMDRPRRG